MTDARKMDEVKVDPREQIRLTIEARVIEQLRKMGNAQHEQTLIEAVATVTRKQTTGASQKGWNVDGWERHTTTKRIPESVIRRVLQDMLDEGRILYKPITGCGFYIATPDATKYEIGDAANRHVNAYSEMLFNTAPEIRRDRFDNDLYKLYKRLKAQGDPLHHSFAQFQLVNPVPLTDPDEVHYSELDTFGDNFTKALRSTYADAMERPSIDSETRDYQVKGMKRHRRTRQVHYPGLDATTRKRVDFQLRKGLAAKNTQRAERARKRKWLATPEGQRWLAIQRNEREEAKAAAQEEVDRIAREAREYVAPDTITTAPKLEEELDAADRFQLAYEEYMQETFPDHY